MGDEEMGIYKGHFKDGEFLRPETGFRRWISREPGARFRPEAGRYHLYVSAACPWSHRTMLMRKLKGLEDAISISVTHPIWNEQGWWFGEFPGATPDTVNGVSAVIDLYRLADPGFSGEETVPILWDKKLRTIVNNESSEIMKMLDLEFGEWARSGVDLYPQELRTEVDRTIREIYGPIANGVYQAGFARNQAAYDRAFKRLFEALERWDRRLSEQRFACGDRLTQADIALYVTLIRFDAVYYSHFKCNGRRILDFDALSRWLSEVHAIPGVSETTDLLHIKSHYYGSHKDLNPTGIIPLGPERILRGDATLAAPAMKGTG